MTQSNPETPLEIAREVIRNGGEPDYVETLARAVLEYADGRVCTSCKRLLPQSAYATLRGRAYGLNNRCRECYSAAQVAKAHAPERTEAQREKDRARARRGYLKNKAKFSARSAVRLRVASGKMLPPRHCHVSIAASRQSTTTTI